MTAWPRRCKCANRTIAIKEELPALVESGICNQSTSERHTRQATVLLAHGWLESAASRSCFTDCGANHLLDALLEPLDLRVVVDDVAALALSGCGARLREATTLTSRQDDWTHPLMKRQRLDAGAIAAAGHAAARVLGTRAESGTGAAGTHHRGQPVAAAGDLPQGHRQRHARAQAPGASCWRTCTATAWCRTWMRRTAPHHPPDDRAPAQPENLQTLLLRHARQWRNRDSAARRRARAKRRRLLHPARAAPPYNWGAFAGRSLGSHRPGQQRHHRPHGRRTRPRWSMRDDAAYCASTLSTWPPPAGTKATATW